MKRVTTQRWTQVAILVAAAILAGAPAAQAARGPTATPPRVVAVKHGTRVVVTTARGARWTEPNRIFRASAVPNDPQYKRQWALRTVGLNALDAWSVATGGEITVAILDSGISDHPDLTPNLWTNPGEVAGNRLDDDANGFVDDVHGANVMTGGGSAVDGFGHGTAVAGVIGAVGNNAIGVTGVAWRVRLLPVRVLDDRGMGNTATLVAGIRYALARGARVINMSVNGPQGSPALTEAIRAAEAQGVLVVASAGNDAQNRNLVPSYPASIPSPTVIAVASTDAGGRLTRDSAFGHATVDIAAPGERILTTTTRGGYGYYSGTSFAAAHASGALALLEAARPASSATQVREALFAGARRGTSIDNMVATGALDLSAALRRLAPREPLSVFDPPTVESEATTPRAKKANPCASGSKRRPVSRRTARNRACARRKQDKTSRRGCPRKRSRPGCRRRDRLPTGRR